MKNERARLLRRMERLVELSGGREDGAEEFFRALRESADAV